MTASPRDPIPYDPDVEHVPDDEAETARELIETLRSIAQTTLKDEGKPLRSVHAKSHALLQGAIEVAQDLPPELAQGMFTAPANHAIVMRFSTIPGDLLDDSVSTPRGVAIKILNVNGERLQGSEGATTQDFVMVNGPAFGAPTPKAFLTNLKLLAATTDKAQGMKKVISSVMQTVQSGVAALTGGPSPAVATLGGQPETHILGETFFTQTPYRFGDYVAKLRLKPTSDGLVALTDKPLAMDRPNALREACVDFFGASGGVWELQAQLRANPDTMPVEDASKVWPEDESPYRTIARIVVEPQIAWNEARSRQVDEGMSFRPWCGLRAHQPLGGVNRTRKPAYEMGRKFRSEHAGRRIDEPTGLNLG